MDFASRPVHRRKSLIWARRAREEQGLYEVEISFGGEADLHNSFVLCDKNPGHKNFTPLKVFDLNHLPLQYRDETLLDLIKAVGDLTVRVTVDHTSNERRKLGPATSTSLPVCFFRADMMRTGTGWVYRIFRFDDENERSCQCTSCKGSDRPFKQCGEIWIVTATHVVFDSSEAEHTTCEFFYDACDKDSDQILKLKGMELVINDVTADWCNLKYVTHDCELLDRIEQLYIRYEKLHKEVYEKVKNNYFDKEFNSTDNSMKCEPIREDLMINLTAPSDVGQCNANVAPYLSGTKKTINSEPCGTSTEPAHGPCLDNNADNELTSDYYGSVHTNKPTVAVGKDPGKSPTANAQNVTPADICADISNTNLILAKIKSGNVSTTVNKNEPAYNPSHDDPHAITTPTGPAERYTPLGNDHNKPSLDISTGNTQINTIPVGPELGNSTTSTAHSEPPSDLCPGHFHDRWPIASTELTPGNSTGSTAHSDPPSDLYPSHSHDGWPIASTELTPGNSTANTAQREPSSNLCSGDPHDNTYHNKVDLSDSFGNSPESCVQPKLTFIVSHPHGQNKQVTIGEWVDKQVTQPMPRLRMTQYTYTTPTCPGSSGAPVYILGRSHWLKCEHPHSGRCVEQGVNQSGYGWDPCGRDRVLYY